nr:MAG TPA: hypothetical protein [Caudoviricetes sp.]
MYYNLKHIICQIRTLPIIYLTGEPGDALHPFRACRRWCL